MRDFTMAVACLALLSACNARTEQASTDESADATEQAAEAPAAPAEPVLTAEGWGPLRIGMSRDDVVAAMGADANPDAIGGPEPDVCDEFRPSRAPDGLFVMIEDGILTRISVTEPADLETDAGISIGASADEVRAAYGNRLHVEPHHYLELPAEYLTVWASGEPVDEPYTDDPAARGIRYETGLERRVQTIHVGSSSIQYIEGCL